MVRDGDWNDRVCDCASSEMGGNGVDGVVAVAGAMTLSFGFLDPCYSPCAGDFGRLLRKRSCSVGLEEIPQNGREIAFSSIDERFMLHQTMHSTPPVCGLSLPLPPAFPTANPTKQSPLPMLSCSSCPFFFNTAQGELDRSFWREIGR
jgi:hypothetical protein